jgi:hypothetical protein
METPDLLRVSRLVGWGLMLFTAPFMLFDVRFARFGGTTSDLLLSLVVGIVFQFLPAMVFISGAGLALGFFDLRALGKREFLKRLIVPAVACASASNTLPAVFSALSSRDFADVLLAGGLTALTGATAWFALKRAGTNGAAGMPRFAPGRSERTTPGVVEVPTAFESSPLPMSPGAFGGAQGAAPGGAPLSDNERLGLGGPK